MGMGILPLDAMAILAIGSFIASLDSFFLNIFLKIGIDKSADWSTIPVCPSLMCFFNRGNTEETKSLKILWLTGLKAPSN